MTFDLTAISAILAVIGYSLNDTVIVFDRIRERARTARKLSIAQVIDESINQTLSRTLMTKLVTLLVVVALLIFGGETLHGILRRAGDRHHRRHLFLDLYLRGAGAGLRPAHRRLAGAQARPSPKKSTACPRALYSGVHGGIVLDPQAWLSFLTLAVLEIVLGIDNIIFLSVLVDRLPGGQRRSARFSAWRSPC